ncbi:c-type cytochrome biogenesis protein CcmI [Yoonia vestfoldensis]|jgi:cytochrome c-type biogenesis protein CcmH|uniref:Cytochro_ccmI: cytochrome c-type biogenesis protein CcmI n=1 Tax=Yoonia vestfoldensis TaxID=245188 RepID=A0A1Y0EBY9_9RHOB|nr:c-type cytochrome biogenesis protein CcmI [Yoonia vestfoldensis]ARU01083.1 cytochro_ccmI: cytochrome c-type biogenesis protein CcmI [Yoonia vestfoldensis]
MTFWIIVGVMTLAVAGLMAIPLLRTPDVQADNPDVAIYRAQLAEIDRDLERGLLDPAEADRSRTEIARRLLAASKMDQGMLRSDSRQGLVAISVLAVVAAVTFATYLQLGAPGYGDVPLQARLAASEQMRANRPAQAFLEQLAPPPPAVTLPEDYRAAIDRLREIAPTRPDDLEAWSRLAFHEVELRNYAGAARAQDQVVSILGDAAGPADLTRLLDLRVVAAGGLVSPEAEQVIRAILALDDTNLAARYYLGLLYDQTDRPDLAYRLWRDLAENGNPASFHAASARQMIEDAAFRAGIDYTLPALRGPSAEDIAAAQDMSPEDRQAMIGGMVEGLADRLANDGGTATDWARLIAAYGVLGDTDNARAIWVEAADVFGANAEAMAILTPAARDAGLLE